jgi:hypothetical protein
MSQPAGPAALVLAVLTPLNVCAGVYFAEPTTFGENNGLIDRVARATTDRAGTWLAEWVRAASFGDPFEIVSVTSTDAGQTWSSPQSVAIVQDSKSIGLASTGADSFVIAWRDSTGTLSRTAPMPVPLGPPRGAFRCRWTWSAST